MVYTGRTLGLIAGYLADYVRDVQIIKSISW